VTSSHPASRTLLLFAAVLALMLVTAVTVAALQNAPSAKADSSAERTAPIQAIER
jgi:hypothetical protein